MTKTSVVHNHINIARKARIGGLKQMIDSYERTAAYAEENPGDVSPEQAKEHAIIRDIYWAVFNEKMAQRNLEEFKEETAELIEELTGKCEEYLVNGSCIHSDHTL